MSGQEIETTKVLKLISPITIEGTEITELTLREPTAGEIDDADKSAKTVNGTTIALIGIISGKHPNVIRMLGARDYVEASKFIKSFLPSDQ